MHALTSWQRHCVRSLVAVPFAHGRHMCAVCPGGRYVCSAHNWHAVKSWVNTRPASQEQLRKLWLPGGASAPEGHA
eukprot:2286900-Rhodomonas_salina.2